jgi:hypothetical protein
MQDEALEVESNVLAINRLRRKYDKDKGRGRSEALTYGSSIAYPQVYELTKMVKSLSADMEKIKMEGRPTYRNPQNVDNIGNRRLNNNDPQIMPRQHKNRDREDHRIQTPLQNNSVDDEKRAEEEIDPEIHCIGDTSPFPHLTQSTYKKSLMDNHLNEMSKEDNDSNNPNRYNLRLKKKARMSDIPERPTREEKSDKDVADKNKGKKIQVPSPVVQIHVLEVKEVTNPTSSFNFEHEIQKIRINVPLSELVKHEDFKKSLSKLFQPEPPYHPTDSVNLQDENP